MIKWSLLPLSLFFAFTANATKSQEQLLKEFNKAYFEIHKQLQGKNLLERLIIQTNKLGEFSDNPFAQNALKQLISTDQSVAGQHFEAIGNYAYKGKNTDSLSIDLQTYTPADAVSVIVSKAQKEQIIMINEAHHIPQHRVLTHQLLKGLWEQGFRYFAVEALAENGDDFIFDDYVTKASGKYIEESTYANLLITAKQLGFTLVSYDYGDKSSRKNRELQAADNLISKIFAHDKDAKVIIHCGYSHIKEQDGWLADVLEKKTGIDPLSINQTHVMEQANQDLELPIYKEVVNTLTSDKPVVFENEGNVWSAMPSDYDVNVVWPHTVMDNSRPTWALLDRESIKVSASLCGNSLPCLVEVYDKNETTALPSDRIILTSENPEAAVFVSKSSLFLKAISQTESNTLSLDKFSS